MDMITAYVSIGNSDDKLRQGEWAAYAGHVRGVVRRHAAHIHGEWASMPFGPWQNACWCFEIEPELVAQMKAELVSAAGVYRQDSIAWAEAPKTEFLGPAGVSSEEN